MLPSINHNQTQGIEQTQGQEQQEGNNDRSLLGGVVRGVGNMTRTGAGLALGFLSMVGQANAESVHGDSAMEFINVNWKPIVVCAAGVIAMGLATTICWASCCCLPDNNGYQPLEGTDSPDPENPEPKNPTVQDHVQMLRRQADQVVADFVRKMDRGERAYHDLWNRLIPIKEELSLMVTIPDTMTGNQELDTLVNVDYGHIFGGLVDDCLARELGHIAFKAAKASYKAEMGHPRYNLFTPEMSELRNFFDAHSSLIVEVRQPSVMCDPNRIV